MNRQEGRRLLLDLSWRTPIAAALTPLVSGCGPSRETQFKSQLRDNYRGVIARNFKEKQHAELKKRFTLSSGIEIYLYSDGDTLSFDQEQFDKAFHAGFTVLESQPNSKFKSALAKTKQQTEEGKMKGKEVHFFAASSPEACNVEGAIAIPSAGQRCESPAATAYVITKDPQSNKFIELDMSITVITAGASNGQALFIPAGTSFILTPEESMTSNLSHEAIHSFLRFVGEPQDTDPEEMFVQKIERDLLVAYRNGQMPRPTPFKFISAP